MTAVLSENLQPAPGMPGWELGTQKIAVRFTNGPMKGRQITLDNDLSMTHNIRVKPGQGVVVKAERPAGEAPYYTLYNYDRIPGLIAVAAVFAVLMLVVGGLKGLRSLLGLCISLYFIFAFLLPTIYRGYSPVLVSFVTVIIIAVFSLLLLNGFSRKTLTAVVATGIGVALAALCFLLISALVHLVGYRYSQPSHASLTTMAHAVRTAAPSGAAGNGPTAREGAAMSTPEPDEAVQPAEPEEELEAASQRLEPEGQTEETPITTDSSSAEEAEPDDDEESEQV